MITVSVFCASSPKIKAEFFQATALLGELLAQSDIAAVCGAGATGLMGQLADSMVAHGGRVIGVMPQFMYDLGWQHDQLSDLKILNSMHERKALMAEMSDASIALPGGCGTLEELLEIITWRQLGLYNKPVIILNTLGYYDDLLRMLQIAVNEQFMPESNLQLWQVASTPHEVIKLINHNLNKR
jgi:uncharacterized protein (TIGR00730 family)